MADNGKKIYSIQINGIEQSIKQVDALTNTLNVLDRKIKDLESRSVSVATNGGNKASDLEAEDRILKQINQTEEQISNVRAENYDTLIKEKETLKEITEQAQQRAAAERLSENAYENTMKGMKQELSDLKKVFNTVDIGSDKFKEMTARAGELTQKLKDIEQSYGQFGRNVGNYKSAFDELKKVTVNIGGVAREFNSVRDASRQLTQELKGMVIAGKEGTKEYEELAEAVHNFEMASRRAESAVNDLKASSKGMDDILDTFESFAALGSVGQGFAAFFGIDDDEIQRSIQKLVALQNVMQGIEKIRLKMKSGDAGLFGDLFKGGNKAVDSFVAKLTGAEIGMNGLTKGSKAATVAVRGLSTALKGFGLGVVIAGISALLAVLDRYTSEASQAELATENLTMAMNALNKAYEDKLDMLSASYMRKEISTNEYLAELFKEQGNHIRENIKYINEMSQAMNELSTWDYFKPSTYLTMQNTGYTGSRISGNGSQNIKDAFHALGTINLSDFDDVDYSKMFKDVKEAEEEFRKLNEAIKDGEDYLSKYGSGLKDWLGSLVITVGDTRDAMVAVGNTIASDYIGGLTDAFTEWQKAQADVAKGVEGANARVEESKKKIKELYDQMNSSEAFKSFLVNMDKYIPDAAVREKLQKMLGDMREFFNNAAEEGEQWVHFWNNKRIAAMADGQQKINAQIEEDLRHEIVLYGNSEEHVNALKAEANRKRLNQQQKYNEQAKQKAKQHAKEMEAVEKELQSLIIQNMADGLDKQIALLEEERRQRLQKAKDNGIKVAELTIEINKLYDKKVKEAKEEWAYQIEQVYINMWTRIYQINHQNAQMDFENQLRDMENNYEKLQEEAKKMLGNAPATYSPNFGAVQDGERTDSQRNYTKLLQKEYDERLANRKEYYAEVERLEIEQAQKEYDIEVKKAKENMNNELRTLVNGYKAQDHELKSHLKKGEITLEQYNEAVKRLEEERGKQETLIQERYTTQAEQRELQHQERIKNIKSNAYNSQLDEYREYLSKLQDMDTSSPVRFGKKNEEWNFINVGATKKRNKEVLASYQKLFNDLENEKATLESKKLELDPFDYENTKKKIEQTQEAVVQGMEKTKEDMERTWEEGAAAVNYWMQAIGQSVNSILSSISEITDNHYQAEIDKQQEYIDEYEDLLDKQKDITQQHADEVNSIEEELSTARGDRRQHLIDQLNAEMAAQRASLAQEKKIEREKQKAEEKQKKLEHDQAVAKKRMQEAQAYINMAMAISMAAVNSWPIPAVPMMALAAATGAAQIAAIKSQNIPSYGSGGVIQGRSHAQGGVKVLGGQAEVEGGEFITNKRTTAVNVDLLEFINTKKRRVNLDDLLEFYGGNAVRKNIQSVRTKFADGGVIPTLRTDLNINDRLINVMEDYSNRPVQVAVVDIIDRTQQVNNVKVMAGLDV